MKLKEVMEILTRYVDEFEYRNKYLLAFNEENLKLAIEIVLKELKRLQKENKLYREFIFETNGKDIQDITATEYSRILQQGYLEGTQEERKKALQNIKELEENSIPKKKIENKIKELDVIENAEALEDIMNRKNYTITEIIQLILQELLEEENENND